MRIWLSITALFVVMLFALPGCASAETKLTSTQAPAQQAPPEGLGIPRPLTLIEEQRAVALAERIPQVIDLTRWGVWGKDTQVTITAVRTENSRIAYYERLNPINPESRTPEIDNYFPAVFYTFFRPMDTGNPKDNYRYLMVILDLPTNRVLEIVNNPGNSGAILPPSPEPPAAKKMLPWIIGGVSAAVLVFLAISILYKKLEYDAFEYVQLGAGKGVP